MQIVMARTEARPNDHVRGLSTNEQQNSNNNDTIRITTFRTTLIVLHYLTIDLQLLR